MSVYAGMASEYALPADLTSQGFKVLIQPRRVNRIVRGLALDIATDNFWQEYPYLIAILHGAKPFAERFIQETNKIDLFPEMEYIRVKSYEATQSSGFIDLRDDVKGDLRGRKVLLLEDIVDTGRTIAFLKSYLLEHKGASEVKVASLLDKPSRRQVKGLTPDYCRQQIDNLFVIGFGLDLDGKYRDLPCICYKEGLS
ncbi:hypoxanthine phosphoribosyltransferase [Candidatus Woesearchaeota archaeon]|nr:hypoxanthine phosphoribosyltransferase [Candidatus Woesearchaeota archaeon]